LYILLKAAALLAAEGALPVNVRFTCDGEEESGGHSIIDFLEADERGGDVCVIFDGNMLAPGKPAFFVATRGIAYFHVRVRTGERDLHSGVFGGAAMNASHVLVQVLGRVLPQSRLVPGQDENVIAAEMERLMREAAPDGADIEIELVASAPAALVQPDDPAIKLGQDAFERVVGARPLLIRIGGSLPVMAALESKEIPTILTGFDLPEGNIHSPNERFRVDHVTLGVETAKELFRSLGELR